MEFFQQFITDYGTMILYAVLTAIAGLLGTAVKNIYQKYVNDKTKREVVKTAVMAVQQLYANLDGEEKLDKALEAISDMLGEKGIGISELEMRMLIEAAVGEFKEAFKNTGTIETETNTEVEG